MRVNQERIWQRIMQLADITLPEQAYTRRAFTDIYLEGRELLESMFKEAALELQLTASANIIGKRTGKKSLPAIALGSHIDTVVEGGRFDGIAGVITALEVAQVLYDENIQLNHPLEIIDFLSEEPSDYGLSCIGSRGHGGRLTQEQLNMTNPEGERLEQAMTRMGANINQALSWQPPTYKAFLELHIEQAKRLEHSATDIGVVTGFAGIWRYRISLIGQTDHAGTTPMNDRQDCMVAAAQIIQVIQQTALGDNSDLVATVGQIELKPNAVNAVPGYVEFSVEIRCLDASKNDLILNAIMKTITGLQNAEAITDHKITQISDVSPAPCDEHLQDILTNACNNLRLSYLPLTSGAGHDAYHMHFVCPSAMIFIPSKDGRSHTPEEYSSPEQLAKGAEVLLEAVLELDRLI